MTSVAMAGLASGSRISWNVRWIPGAVDPRGLDQLVGHRPEVRGHQVDVERQVQRRVEQDHRAVRVEQPELHHLDVDRHHQEQRRDGDPGEHEEVDGARQAPAELRERVAGERRAEDGERDRRGGDDHRVAEVDADVRARPRALERPEGQGRRQADLCVRPVGLRAERRRGHEQERQHRREAEKPDRDDERPRVAACPPSPPARRCGRCGGLALRHQRSSLRVRTRIWNSPIANTITTSVTPIAAAYPMFWFVNACW